MVEGTNQKARGRAWKRARTSERIRFVEREPAALRVEAMLWLMPLDRLPDGVIVELRLTERRFPCRPIAPTMVMEPASVLPMLR